MKGNNINRELPSLKRNSIYLVALNLISYLIPLITIPYVTRILGVKNYGLYAIAYLYVSYFIVLTDFSFNYGAIREISKNRNNNIQLSKIFMANWMLQLLLCLIGLIFTTVLYYADIISSNILLAYGQVIGSVILPAWFFLVWR